MNTIPLSQRAIGAYLGLAVGDALGATTEFMTPNEIQNEYGVHTNIIGGGWLRLKPGQVTDDTQMSLALGQSMLDNHGVVQEKVAESFSEWMRSKPVDIGNTVRRGIIHFRTTGQAQVPVNEHGAGNGACMRCLPLALFYHQQVAGKLIHASRLQSRVTHHNPVSDAGTETVLAMLVAALHEQNLSELNTLAQALVKRYGEFRFDGLPIQNPSGWIVETLQTVFQCLFGFDSFEDSLVSVVNRGGDADTTGAIAGMLCGAYYGVHSIPQRWVDALEFQTREACRAQALALMEHAAGIA